MIVCAKYGGQDRRGFYHNPYGLRWNFYSHQNPLENEDTKMSFTGFFMKIIDLLMVLTGGYMHEYDDNPKSINFIYQENLKNINWDEKQTKFIQPKLNLKTAIQEVLFEMINQ